MVLDDNNILQADATVIAGLVIFVTLLSFKPPQLERLPEFVVPAGM